MKLVVLIEDALGALGTDFAADADGFELVADAGEVGGVAFAIGEEFEDDGLLKYHVNTCPNLRSREVWSDNLQSIRRDLRWD